MDFVMTIGVERLSTRDWQLIVSIITRLYEDNEFFLSFEARDGKTVVTDGDGNHLCSVDKLLFPRKVWAIYGNDGKTEYYTVLLPEEY
ncbi:hypothetical protein [Paenibacillus piri]|uniref:Uncharacterized protein n=1 Tax=Paenibacillus piri TaxID=2547395 RepID=A0A4R5KZ41_9BACL|nr:hypothetical protein [Paenibacillus piri]TDG00893.1 hypothetical protein E1757_04585 [Paenibacillus piri]